MTTTINSGHKKLNAPNLRFPEFHNEWKETKIGCIADIVGGGTPDTNNRAFWNGGIQWFTPSEIGQYKFVKSSFRTISEEGLKNSSAKMLPSGSILLSSRATIGECSINIHECATNQGFQSLVPHDECFNEFVFYLIQTKRKDLIRKSCGSTFLEISANEIRKIDVTIPNLKNEQYKIANLMALLDARIETQSRAIEDLKKLKTSIIERTLSNCQTNITRLGDIGTYVRGLTYNSSDVVEQNGTIVMRSNNIVGGDSLDYENNIVIVDKEISDEQRLHPGDVVICMANGSSSLVGKSSFYDGGCLSPITVGAFCGIYRSKEPIMRWYFQTSKYRRYIWNSLQGGNGAIANLNGEDIIRMSFGIPDAYFKEKLVKLLSTIDTQIKNNQILFNLFLCQKQYLLRQMFV